MKILHISNNLLFSKIYLFLIETLSEGLDGQAFISFNYLNSSDKILDSYKKYCSFFTFKYRLRIFRFFFLTRSLFYFIVVALCVPIRNYSFVHAHTLCSDGFLAFLINFFFKVNYVVTVRNTDINIQIPKRFYYKPIFYLILKKSSVVIFPNYAYRERLFSYFPSLRDTLFTRVIPSCVDKRFYDLQFSKCFNRGDEERRILCVSDCTENKNIKTLIKAVQLLDQRYCLTIIGCNEVSNLPKDVGLGEANRIRFHRRINDVGRLIEKFQEHDVFCLVSYTETFGLVYLEALLCGVPVVFSKGEAISGVFPSDVAKPADPNSPGDVARVISSFFPLTEGTRRRAVKFGNQMDQNMYKNLHLDAYRSVGRDVT